MSATTCPHCHKEITRSAARCPRCGARLPGEQESVPDFLGEQIQAAVSGKYKIRREVGRGGMAVVYEAEDLALERRVALKLLLPDFAQDDEVLERFRREGIVASKLEHPGIVPIYNISRADRFWYIAMKFVDGQNLKQFLRSDGMLSLEHAVRLLKPIAQALDYAHEIGVIHRDIKSSNILISKSNRLYLSDFGIAKAVDTMSVTRTGAIVGTPEYMSPEQADGKVCDHRADLYSFAVVIYEALLGHPPFKGETPFATALKHINEEPMFPSGTSSDLVAILRKGLAKSPAKRYQTAAAMILDLESVSGGHSLQAREKTPRRVTVREETPKRLSKEGRETPAHGTGPETPASTKKKSSLAFSIAAAAIVTIFIMMLIPDSGTRKSSDIATQEVNVPPTLIVDTSHGERGTSAEIKSRPSAQTPGSSGAQKREELVLNISTSLRGSDGLRAYIIPSVDTQYGEIECIKDEGGSNVLRMGSKIANGSDLEITSTVYVEQNAVMRDLHLPANVKFSRTGGFVIVVLGPGSGGTGRDIVGFKPFHVEADGNVANFDGLDFSGNQRIVSFIIE